MPRLALPIVLLATLALTSCASPGQTPAAAPANTAPSTECLTAMSDLAAETDDPKIDPLIAASLDTCATVSAWMGALREHPGAMALTDASFVTTALVGVVCVQHSTTATCKDAAAQGIAG